MQPEALSAPQALPYDFVVRTIDGDERTLAAYRGKVLLIVNVASLCGFTPQYQGLEQLYRRHHAAGLEVLAFPSNQFGMQEPGTDAEIKAFCSTRYGISFPLFSKIDVNGESTHPLYRWLKSEAPGLLGSQRIKWNFTKFLVDRTGRVIGRFAPGATPVEIEEYVIAELR
ncbi:MAG: glutathione peroxidase [Polyangiaceae bacterium]|nr:glutathione peroxidase [Polyangiaceae bacterium]